MLFLGFIPPSCCLTNSCGCGKANQPRDYFITDLSLRNIDSNREPIDTSLYYLHNNNFKLIEVAATEFVFHLEEQNKVGFFAAALACSPIPPRSVNPIYNIQVEAANTFALNNEEDVISTGENITSRFEIGFLYAQEFEPLSEFNSDPYETYEADLLRIKLISQPYQPSEMKLNIKIKLKDATPFDFNDEIMKVM